MFEYMACEKPVIVGINGEAETMKKIKSGICVHPEDPEMDNKAILNILMIKKKNKLMERMA